MSFWKKSMEYLGLGPDDAYDDYDEAELEPQGRSSRAPRDDNRQGRSSSSSSRGWPAEPDSGSVRAVPARPSFPSRDFDASRRTSPADESGTVSRPRGASPSRQAPPPPPPNAEPATVRPRRFDQAQELADRFKEGNSVILNLESADRDVARRLIDFASGVCYSLDGTMEKVATGVYLLKPAPARLQRFDDYES
jgi:cell division inhibitor SepF